MDSSNEELTRLSDLIGLIYEGATNSGLWAKEILPALAEYMEAPECFLYTMLQTPRNGGYFFFHGISQDQVDLYLNKYFSEGAWVRAAYEKDMVFEGNVAIGDDLIPREQWLASKIYNECFQRDANMAQLITSAVFGIDSANAMPTACSLFRGLHHPDFNDRDIARMGLVLPHLSRSLGVMQRLQSAELTVATSLAALDRLASGVLLLNESGAVTFANRSAQRMLQDGDGLRLNKSGNMAGHSNLIAANTSADAEINEAIYASLNRDPYDTPHFSKCVTVPRSSSESSYTLQFSALGDHNEFGAKTGSYSTIIFIADSTQETEIDPAMLQTAYGLTPAEAKVAITLLESSSALDVANKLGTSSHTVNTQIKHIYAKLGVDTRTRFVKLLLGLARHRA